MAYGGFNASETPTYRVTAATWLKMTAAFTLSASLRGGGEYGAEWHEAGTKLKKQNVFDDFIAAGEWLIANKYTTASKLAINGGSNGGLLVGAVLNQRPELFGAAVPAVGVMDMLRFHNSLTIGGPGYRITAHPTRKTSSRRSSSIRHCTRHAAMSPIRPCW